MPKVYFACGLVPEAYRRMFQKFGWEIVPAMEDADLVQFCGGADVNPALYGESVHRTTSFNDAQDRAELSEISMAMAMKIPMVGICRGAQLLNVAGGGSLYQDVNNHAIFGTHPAVDLVTGDTIEVTSTHHQMMRPSKHAKIFLITMGLATIKESQVNGQAIDLSDNNIDVEGCYYPNINALCIQGHPEKTVKAVDPFQEYYFETIKRYLGV